MTADQESDAPREEALEGVGEPAKEQTMIEVPPPVDPKLVERAHHLQEEIAEDEQATDEPPRV